MANEYPVPSSNAETTAVATTNGQTAFSFDWRADAADQVHAVYRPVGAPERVLELGVDFSVQGLQNPAGGSILLVGFSANKDDVIYMFRETLIEREKKWQNEGDYKADLVNKEQDEIYMILQENRRDLRSNSSSIAIEAAARIAGDQALSDRIDGMVGVVNDAAQRAENAADASEASANSSSDAADRAEAAAAGLNLPPITSGDKGKALVVNDDEDGYLLENIEADVGIYDTKSDAEAANIPLSVNAIRLNGGETLGDGNGGLYSTVNNGSTDTFFSADGRTWWRVNDPYGFGLEKFKTIDDVNNANVRASSKAIDVGGVVYNRRFVSQSSKAEEIFQRLSEEVSTTRKVVITNAINRLMGSSTWNKISHLYVLAMGLVDWKNPSGLMASAVDSPHFYKNIGYQGNQGVDGLGYIDTGISAASFGSPGNMHLAAYVSHDYTTDGEALIGTVDGNRLRIVHGGNDLNVRLCDEESTTGGSRAPRTGLFLASRMGNNKTVYVDGNLVHSQVSTPLPTAPTENISFLTHTNSTRPKSSPRTVFGGSFGEGLSPDEVLDIGLFFDSLRKGFQLRDDHFISSGDGSFWERSNAVVQGLINLNEVGADKWPWLARLNRQGLSNGNSIQSHVIDERNGHIYTHHIRHNAEGSKEGSVINRFPWPCGGDVSPIDFSLPDVRLGHQGLSIEYGSSGDPIFWASAPYGSDIGDGSGNGNYVSRFYYDNGKISNISYFKIFDLAGSNQACSPTISYDGSYLIAKQNYTGGRWLFKVFKLSDLYSAGSMDANGTEYKTFTLDRVAPLDGDLQSIACLDGVIYVVVEPHGAVKTGKIIIALDFDGNILSSNYSTVVGLDYCRSNPSGDLMEYEGACFANINGKPSLTISVVAGAMGSKEALIYAPGVKAWGSGGEYSGVTRSEDGTMEAWGRAHIIPVANTMSSTKVTLPDGFISNPVVTVTPQTSADTLDRCAVANITKSDFDIFVRRSNTVETGIMWMAKGRWS